MKINRTLHIISAKLAVALFFGMTVPAHAFRVVDGSLGSWLEREASPKLVEMLVRHPRLKGQRLKIMGIEDGNPVALSNKLGADIKDQLTQDLLTQTGIRLVFDERAGCARDKTSLVLGIVTQRHDSNRHRVTVAMVDVEEGLWLGGANFSWNGRLTDSQRLAFRTSLSGIENRHALDVHSIDLIADALAEQVDCLPTIESPVFFLQKAGSLEQSVLPRLIEQFSRRSRVVGKQAEAKSILRLHHARLAGNNSALSLTLASVDSPELVQQIAKVNVSGVAPGALPAAYANEVSGAGTRSGEGRRYLSELTLSNRTLKNGNGRCANKTPGCVRVHFELYRPAFVVAFYTRNGVPVPLNCRLGAEHTAGKHQINVDVPYGSELNRPTLGVYTLAFSQRGPAEILQRELNMGSPSCSSSPSEPDTWVSSFTRALSRYKQGVEWRALHLMRDGNGITRL